MKRYAIFDLDGTLLNTLDDLANATNQALAALGLPEHSVDAYRYFVGNGVPKLLERATPETLCRDKKTQARLREKFDEWYGAHGQDSTRPYDGVPEMLDGLLERGLKLAVLSNKPHRYAQEMVPYYFGNRFAAIYGLRDGYPAKPDGSLVKEVLDALGATADETLYLGDSGVDMQTARNGGVWAIGALWGFRTREELLENGAQALADKPEQVLSLLNEPV